MRCVLQAGVLFANGVAILNNDRFLEKSEGYALLTYSYPSASYHLAELLCMQLAGDTLR